MKIYLCDLCGEKIERFMEREGAVKPGTEQGMDFALPWMTKFANGEPCVGRNDFDLCGKCIDGLRTWISERKAKRS